MDQENNICKIVHSTVEGLYSAGTLDQETIRILNEQCVGVSKTPPDEGVKITSMDHIKIVDADTNEEILNKRG